MRLPAVVTFYALTIVSCGAPQASVLHSSSAAAALEPPLNWVVTSAAELDATSSSTPAVYLPAEAAMVRRLQFWSDQLFDRIQKDHQLSGLPAGSFRAPRPQIHIKDSGEANGYVLGTTVCRRVPVRFTQAAAGSDAVSEALVALDQKGRVGLYPYAAGTCIDRRAEPADAATIAAYLQTLQSRCQVSAEHGELRLGQGCILPKDLTASLAAGITLPATGVWITLSKGLIVSYGSEDAVLTALTHELGHYYRAHGSLDHQALQYFYTADETNRARAKPVADPRLEALGKQLLRMGKVRVQPISGQHFSSWLFSYNTAVLATLVKPACSEGQASCHQACQPWLDLLQSSALKTAFGTFPQAQLQDEGLLYYWRYEQTMQSCLGAIAIAPTAGLDRAAASDVTRIYWKAGSPAQPTVLAAAEAMNQQLLREDAANDALLQQALDRQLGYYTTEQEADNLGLIWLSRLGIAPEAAIKQWFAYGASTDRAHLASRYDFNHATCLELYNAVPRWTRAGQPVQVPIGTFGDNHHSTCYRIYNLDRQNHDLPLGDDLHGAVQAAFGDWDEMLQAL